MKILKLTARAAVLICCVFAAFTGAAGAQKADPAKFGALPAIAAAEISPDGKTLGLLQNLNGESYVVFVELDKPGSTPKGVAVGDVKGRTLRWIGNDYLLLLASITRNAQTSGGQEKLEMWRWISISREDRSMDVLFMKDAGFYVSAAGDILATRPDDPDTAVFARWIPGAIGSSLRRGMSVRLDDKAQGGYSLVDVNLKSGRERLAFEGRGDTVDWVVNAAGEPVLRIDYKEISKKREIYRRREGTRSFELIKSIQEQKGFSSISFYGLADTPTEVYVSTYGNGNTRGLFTYDVNNAQLNRVVFQHERYDFESVIYDPRIATAIGIQYTDDLPRTKYIDPDLQKLQESLNSALPHAAVMIDSKSADGSKMLIRAVYADRPDEYYIFDKPSRNLAFFSSAAPPLADKVYAEKSKFDYTADDGFQIDGYLTIPAGAAKQNLPLIVLPHGGPESRDDMSFDWWASFYAARGYAVYQPNFRGSYGYGLAFREAGYGEWGRKMQDDITKGVQKLIADGVVDAERICIVGASYGGYAALAGATLTPDLYKCAVSVNGVADLVSMLGKAARTSSIGADYWEVRIGSRFRDSKDLGAVSPTKNAAKAASSIMLIHSKDDTVVPFYQSERMSTALSNAGKQHTFVPLDGEDHWLSTGEMRIEVLRRSIEFIDEHIGG